MSYKNIQIQQKNIFVKDRNLVLKGIKEEIEAGIKYTKLIRLDKIYLI